MKRFMYSAALVAALVVLGGCSAEGVTAPQHPDLGTYAPAYHHNPEEDALYCVGEASGYQGSDGRWHECPKGD